MNDGVRRIAGNKQLVSIPNHNYQLKLQRCFRVAVRTSATANVDLSTSAILRAIRSELGIGDEFGSIQVSIHEARIYQSAFVSAPSSSSVIQNALAVRVYNSEEVAPSESINANLIALYEDFASPSGVAHVGVAFSVSNRPTFNLSTPSNNFLSIAGSTGCILAVDVIATVMITPVTLPVAEDITLFAST